VLFVSYQLKGANICSIFSELEGHEYIVNLHKLGGWIFHNPSTVYQIYLVLQVRALQMTCYYFKPSTLKQVAVKSR